MSKYFSPRILRIIFKVVYTVKISVLGQIERTKQWRPWSDCSLRSSQIRVFIVCHSICFIYTSYCNENPNYSILGYFSILISGVPILKVSIWKCLLITFECRKWLLWVVTVRIMFLLDQAGSLKIRWNLVLYARLCMCNWTWLNIWETATVFFWSTLQYEKELEQIIARMH